MNETKLMELIIVISAQLEEVKDKQIKVDNKLNRIEMMINKTFINQITKQEGK